MGKISREPDSVSGLELHLPSFWSEADISLETEDEFLRAREMSQGAIGYLCREMQLMDSYTMAAAINKEWSDPQPGIGCDDLSLPTTDNV